MKKKIVLIIASILVLLILLAVYFSFKETAVINPISSIDGILKILYTEEKYVVVQEYPYKVIFSKPTSYGKTAQELLDEYMNEKGFATVDRQGGLIVYSNGTEEERIIFSVNGYYSKWEWI